MIIPSMGLDDLGQKVKTVFTFLRYRVVVGICQKNEVNSVSPLELLEEELLPIPKKDIKERQEQTFIATCWKFTFYYSFFYYKS